MPVLAQELGLDVQRKGQLLSAFPLGYMMTQVLGGAASDRCGGKPVMAVALVSVGAGILAMGSWSGFEAMWLTMLFMGLLEGPSFPTNGTLLARWIPSGERASATAISDAGGPVGGLVALFLTPQLAAYFGWRITLWISGLCTLAFALLWLAWGANGPDECAYIEESELVELRDQGVLVKPGSNGKSCPQADGGPAIPWKILCIPSVWSVLLGHACFNYNRYLMYNWILTYYTDALKVPVAEAGLCMFWPNVVDALASIAVGRGADALARSGRMRVVTIRRLFSALGFLGTGVGAVLLVWAEGRGMVTLLVTIASAAQAFHNAGFKSSYGDLSRQYSGLLRGLGNTVGTASSFVVPLLAAGLLERGGGSADRTAWHAVFQSILMCSLAGTASYATLVSAECVDEQLAAEGGGLATVPPGKAKTT